MMLKHLTTIKLRNEYCIYEENDSYIVEGPIGKSGEISRRTISKEIVNMFLDIFKGRKISISEAINIINSKGYDQYLETTGWKQKYEVQAILLCMVAKGHGQITKEGKKYVYEIH